MVVNDVIYGRSWLVDGFMMVSDGTFMILDSSFMPTNDAWVILIDGFLKFLWRFFIDGFCDGLWWLTVVDGFFMRCIAIIINSGWVVAFRCFPDVFFHRLWCSTMLIFEWWFITMSINDGWLCDAFKVVLWWFHGGLWWFCDAFMLVLYDGCMMRYMIKKSGFAICSSAG